MHITVNGHVEELGDITTVEQLIQRHRLQPVRVAVEVNERLVPRRVFSATELRGGDRVEIVTLVGGG